MKKFSIRIPEVHVTEIELFAESEEKALEKAQLIYIEDDLEPWFDHTKEPSEWEIKEIETKEVIPVDKKEAIIQDVVDTCINDHDYMKYIVTEHFKNMSSDEIDLLYEELELNQE